MKRIGRAPAVLFLTGMVVVLAAGGLVGRAGARGHRPSAQAAADLLTALWPAYLDDLTGRKTGFSSWAEGDRRYVWLRALLAAGRPGPDAARQRAAGKPADSTDAALRRVLGALPAGTGGDGGAPCLSTAGGGLAWPARGRLAAAFESGRASRQGIALATAADAPVRAACGGQVVFTGRLRGRGRVLIIAHGLHYHTVYACLADVAVPDGAIVSRGTLLGRAGVCPPAGGPGVYFELRFRKKALNPAEWFAASE